MPKHATSYGDAASGFSSGKGKHSWSASQGGAAGGVVIPPPFQLPSGQSSSFALDEEFPSLAQATQKSTAVSSGLSFARVAKAGVVLNEPGTHNREGSEGGGSGVIEEMNSGVDLSQEPLCPFAVVGKCRYGEYCRNLHGIQCPHCGKCVLHPYNADDNESHMRGCEPRQKSGIDSKEVECAICYEKVLSKKDGRFGLLS